MKRWPLALIPLALLGLWLAVRNRGGEPTAPVIGRPAESRPPAPPSQVPTAPPAPGTLRLWVTGPEGRPLPKAAVVVGSEERDDRREFETDAAGARELLGIPAGHYAVRVRFPGLVSVDAHADIEPGRTCELRLRLAAGATLHGSVLAVGGGLLPGVRVALLDPKSRGPLHRDLAAATDAQGRYEIRGIPPQDVSVSFQHPRYRLLFQEGVALRRPEDSVRLDAHLQEGTRIAGRVLDAKGEPIAGATVLAVNECTVAGDVDAKGRFEIGGLGDQPLIVSARARGFGEQWLYRVPPGAANLELRLPRGGSISGKVVADPLPPGQSFVLSRFEPDLGAEARMAVRARVDERGGFVAADIAPGTYWLDVEAPGYERAERVQVTVHPERVTEGVEVRLRKKS